MYNISDRIRDAKEKRDRGESPWKKHIKEKNEMACEIVVKMRTKEKSLTQKFPAAEGIKVDIFDEDIQRCINHVSKEFGETAGVSKIKVSINLEV